MQIPTTRLLNVESASAAAHDYFAVRNRMEERARADTYRAPTTQVLLDDSEDF